MTATTGRTRAEQHVLDRVPRGLLVGSWRPAASGATFAVDDPATGEELIRVADACPDDALAALTIADDAGRSWAATSPRKRSEILRRAYDVLVSRTDELALLITLEMGKPLAESHAEVSYGSDYVRWYAEEAVRVGGRCTTSPDGRSHILTTRRPVGVALLITPWNFPLAMATRKIAPALASGCTVVLKPAELTPLTSLLVADIFLQAGVPEGVLNVVTTTDPAAVSSTLMADPRTRKVSFTGSTPIGQLLIAQSAGQLLRTSMELGGNAPLVVLNDADLDRAVDGAVLAKLRNGGQSCVAANRILVQDGIAEAFVERFAKAIARSRVGRGTDPLTTVGPLIDDRAVRKCSELVADAVDKGARVLTGGAAPDGPGHFYLPTVLDCVPDHALILHEEVFGPVAPICRFTTEAEAISLANATPYGLAAYVFTQDVDRAVGFADALDAGMVGVNQGAVSNVAAPFGGIKHSGLGREGGPEGIEEYLDVKYYAVNGRS
jgi:succinate-semialdehyde dehydrogenase/glutarate-semialdehyde dehydrogenase